MGTVPFQERHHTAEAIRNSINSIAKDSLGVDVHSCVWHPVIATDSYAAISAAMDDPAGRWFLLKCALHNLSNMAKTGLSTSGMNGSVVEKLQHFINFLSFSNIAR